MPIKRTAPVSTQQELQISNQVVYHFKPNEDTAPSLPPAPKTNQVATNFLVRDLLKTALTSAFILAIVLIVMWRGWLK